MTTRNSDTVKKNLVTSSKKEKGLINYSKNSKKKKIRRKVPKK